MVKTSYIKFALTTKTGIKIPVQTAREFKYSFNYKNLYIILNSILLREKKIKKRSKFK